MHPEAPVLNPSELQQWNPYSVIIVLIFLLPLLGGAVVWATTRGMERWIKLVEFHRKWRAAEIETRNKQDQSKRLIDKILEGKNVAEGYKALLILYDARVRDLENKGIERDAEIRVLGKAHMDCVEEHAKCTERCENLEIQVNELKVKYDNLKNWAQGVDPRMDRYPSPNPKQEKPNA